MLNKIKKYYSSERLNSIDLDFLEYEEEMIEQKDLDLILNLLETNKSGLPNPHNSIILYVSSLSDEFDFKKARCNTVDGSPPDIDIDFDAQERHKAIDWVIEKWGRDNVANIITHGTFKPKSLIKGYYRVTEEEKDKGTKYQTELEKKIPPPKFGKEATMSEILDMNPDIQKRPEYSSLLNFSEKLEDMVSTFGIHAAGVVISDFPIHDVVPMWKNSKAERITQFDKDEVENLGLIKFDFLSIDNLSIIKECVKLIKHSTGKDIDIFDLEDGNEEAYNLLNTGILAGIFQMETSGTAKNLIQKIQPQSIEELSDISALNRPGPMQAGLDAQYIDVKNNGFHDEMPESVKKILKNTNYTLVYQEQVMQLCVDLAGFTLQESDDVRRAMGKKKASVLAKWRQKFIDGCVSRNTVSKEYAENLWIILAGDPDDPTNNGFADYCLHGDTKIKTKEYGYLKISDIVKNYIDATVYSYDIKNNKIIEQKIAQYWQKGVKNCFTYSFENIKVTCTDDHKFLTKDLIMIPIEQIYQNKTKLKVKENGKNL